MGLARETKIMVRYYKRKTNRRSLIDEDMKKALEEAHSNGNVKRAGKAYGIPATTLIYRENSVTAKYGRPTVFTKEEEDEIEETCIMFTDWGSGLGRREVEGVITSYLESNKRKNPFINNSPGSDPSQTSEKKTTRIACS